MEVRLAKELLHIQHWLEVAASIVANGKAAYDADEVAQEAGDSLMIKSGEDPRDPRARRPGGGELERRGEEPREARPPLFDHRPRGAWQTLFVSLPAWATALAPLFSEAAAALDADEADGADDR